MPDRSGAETEYKRQAEEVAVKFNDKPMCLFSCTYFNHDASFYMSRTLNEPIKRIWTGPSKDFYLLTDSTCLQEILKFGVPFDTAGTFRIKYNNNLIYIIIGK
jgi:hypothetical protein